MKSSLILLAIEHLQKKHFFGKTVFGFHYANLNFLTHFFLNEFLNNNNNKICWKEKSNYIPCYKTLEFQAFFVAGSLKNQWV